MTRPTRSGFSILSLSAATAGIDRTSSKSRSMTRILACCVFDALEPAGFGARPERLQNGIDSIADVRAHGMVRRLDAALIQRIDQVPVKSRRQRRAAGRDVEQPVETQDVVLLDHLRQR